MTKVLFICHGNICRSPMAEFVMKDLVAKAGLSDKFEIASAATSTEEIGNPVYPPARRKLAEHGISCEGKTARQMTRRDYETYDYLIAMDHNNLSIPAAPAMWPTHGIPGTLKLPGRMCWKAARLCWKNCADRRIL